MIKIVLLPILFLMLLAACKPAQKTTKKLMNNKPESLPINIEKSDRVLENILHKYPEKFEKILNNKENRVQIIYTEINRNKNNNPEFTDYNFNLNTDEYFYPASTVKLPVAILALQKLNELNIPGLDKNTMMITEAGSEIHKEVYNDPNSTDGRPTIANYIRRILLVSDNDAFNRLYEFLGQEYINNTLHKMGYDEVQIIHRLDISMTEKENRYTNAVNFYDDSTKLIYAKPYENSNLEYANRNTKIGKGFYRGGQLINEPFDFSQKNRLSLKTLLNILKSIIFPESVTTGQRFNLSADDYLFLRKYMSMKPGESVYPAYDSINYPANYVKFLLRGAEKGNTNDGIRIFNKVGDAYGFLIDAAYIVDFNNKIEFMLCAIIYCNNDGILNDDNYDYDTIGFPFMKNLGEVIYDHELKRNRRHRPNLNQFIFDYKN